jgi:hypothetical protein
LLIGAGFSRNWGGPLSEEITGSLLGELHDDAELANALRQGPFEDGFQGFAPATGSPDVVARQRRFQDAVSGVFSRLNKTFLNKQFELPARPRNRLFRLVFESHEGTALVPIPKRSMSP